MVTGDATTRAANEAAVRAAADAFGGLDTLVNCVGIFDFYRGLEELDVGLIYKPFDEMFALNVKSCLHAVKAALPALRASGRSSVILTESTSAYYPGRGGVLYVSSKFAVRGLVTALAHEPAPGIRVNGVAPGGTLGTDLRGLSSLGLDTRRLDDTPGRKPTSPPASRSRSPCPARTTPGATCSSPRTAPGALPETSSTLTAASPSGTDIPVTR